MDIVLQRILSLMKHKPDGKIVHGETERFAETIGLKSATIVTMWKSGKSRSYRNYLYQIAEAYNVSVEWLCGRTDIKKSDPSGAGVSEIKRKAIQMIETMTDEECQKLVEFLEMAKK